MAEQQSAPSIYDFLDVVLYLQSYFDWRKGLNKSFTYLDWSLETKIGSPTILRFILQRKRSISQKAAQSFAAALNLNEQETEYFFNLVSYSQAKMPATRQAFAESLLKTQRRQYKQFAVDPAIVSKNVYGPVLLTLLTFDDIQKTTAHLAEFLQVQPAIVSEVLNDFVTRGIVNMDEQGIYHYANDTMKIPDTPGSEELKRYYDFWINQSITALHNKPVEERKFRSLKFALSETEFAEIQERINDFAMTLLNRHHQSSMVDRRLYMLNTALFPVTVEQKGD